MAPHSSTLAWKIPWTGGAWQAAVHGVANSQTRLSDFTLTFHFHALAKEMATHSSVLAWRITGTRESGGLPSMGSHRVGHEGSDTAAAAAAYIQIQKDFQFKGQKKVHKNNILPTTVEKVLRFSKKLNQNYLFMQNFQYFYMQRKLNQYLEEILTMLCLLQHYSH